VVSFNVHVLRVATGNVVVFEHKTTRIVLVTEKKKEQRGKRTTRELELIRNR
jgi:hypothetical protein